MKIKIDEESSVPYIDESEEIPNLPKIVDITDNEQDDDVEDVRTCWLCEAPGVETSQFYCEVQYCGEEHKVLHHPADHDEPWPFIVRYKPGVGRFMVAARDIDQGELIFTEEALAIGPHHTLTTPHCLECLKPVEDETVCEKCLFPVCNQECATGEWHAKECAVFTKNKDTIDQDKMKGADAQFWPITALRCLSLAKSCPANYNVLKRMISHKEEQMKQDSWHLYKIHLVDFLRQSCNLADTFTEDDILHVMGVIDVNSVKLNNRGHGLYPATAILSHNCTANTKTIMNEDRTSDCRAVLPIPKGSEITKSYVSSMETTQVRQRRLLEGWYFLCRCLRCCDPLEGLSFTSAVACLKCRTGLILSTNPLDASAKWQCGDCGEVKNPEIIQKLNDYFLDSIIASIGDIPRLEDSLEKAGKMFHPNHYVPTLLRIKLNTAYLQLGFRNPDKNVKELLMRRKEFLDEVYHVIETVEPGLTQLRGCSLFERSACHLQLGRALYDDKKFPKEEFVKLLESEIASLEDVMECLEHSSPIGNSAEVPFKAAAARDEAESWLSQLADE